VTITINPSKPASFESVTEVKQNRGTATPASRKNKELQKHLSDIEYIDERTQFLVFELAHDVYALEILTVREIMDIPPITRVPRTPPFMLGVINLRGSVVPVVDLKQRFGFVKTDITESSCIIIVEFESGTGQSRVFGLLVDAVQEVINLTPDLINEVTKVGVHIDTQFLKGVGNYEGDFVLIMDLEKVLPVAESF
jgi:purine-binding chemotaxis protein CheW